jgi:hypothetical protein
MDSKHRQNMLLSKCMEAGKTAETRASQAGHDIASLPTTVCVAMPFLERQPEQ